MQNERPADYSSGCRHRKDFRRLEWPGVNLAGEITPTKRRRIDSPVGPPNGKATDTAYLAFQERE